MTGHGGEQLEQAPGMEERQDNGVTELMSLVAIEEYLEDMERDASSGSSPRSVKDKKNGEDDEEEGKMRTDDPLIPLAHDWSKKERSLDVQATGKEAETTFEDLQLQDRTLVGLKRCGFYVPSPIQLKAIPFGKFGYDLILQSKSGTGKTCAFGVIILEQLDLINSQEKLQALVLAPTREIAHQNSGVIKGIGCLQAGLAVRTFIGGTSVEQSIRRSKECNVASGTPGRILHMITDEEMDVSNIQILVLDEADKLMEYPFISDVTAILEALPTEKQVIAASATYSESLKSFVKRFMHQPMEIAADVSQALLAIGLYAADVHKILDKAKNANQEEIFKNKIKVLLELIQNLQFTQAMVFATCMVVDKIYDVLKEHHYDAAKLTGAMTQMDRLAALRDAQQGKCKILVSSDLGARGLDCEGVDLVINFETPDDCFTFVHRYGRAGRFGSAGTCVTLMTFGQEFRRLAEFSKEIKFEVKVIQTLQQIQKLGQGQAQKLQRLLVKDAKTSLHDVENENWKIMFDHLMNQPLDYPSLTMDLFAGYKLNVDFEAMWRNVEAMKRQNT